MAVVSARRMRFANMPDFRMLDACLNRAREAIRVLEDVSRFSVGRNDLALSFKGLRHELSNLFASYHRLLLGARDVAGDRAREARGKRPDSETAEGLVLANAKRAQEALRSLEEGAAGLGLAPRLSRIRFRIYELEPDLLRVVTLLHRVEEARLYVILDPAVNPRLERVCRGCVRGGADMVQLRAAGLPDAELFRLAERLRGIARSLIFIVNNRADVARAAGADGVHLGRDDLPIAAARKIVGPFAIVGATTHGQAELSGAATADYLSYGPVYSTSTKPHLLPVGFSYLRSIQRIRKPFFAIGGIHAGNLRELVRRGIQRVAVCGAVLRADDPAAACRRLRRAVGG